METQFSRTELLLGQAGVKRLSDCRVAVFGVGGVGGYVVEALARSGVGAMDLIDHDTVAFSNLNRQIIALHSTLGELKVEAARKRILDINPDCQVTIHDTFFLPETADTFDFSLYDYVVDAIDTVSGKIALVMECEKTKTPIICSMGAGNKLDASAFRVADIYKTNVCPLARVMRRELKKRGIRKLKVVYSEEQPMTPVNPAFPEAEQSRPNSNSDIPETEQSKTPANSDIPGTGQVRRQTPGSVAFVPSVCGLIIAGEVVRDLCGI